MPIVKQINEFISTLSPNKRSEIQTIHDSILKRFPSIRLWFDTGLNEENKAVTNPSIGYGFQILHYAKGNTREFFQIGLSPTKSGISVYILGLTDKTYLVNTYKESIGKAKITGYCIAFKSLKDIQLDVLMTAIEDGIRLTSEK